MSDRLINFEQNNESWLMPKFLEKLQEDWDKFESRKRDDAYDEWAEEFREQHPDEWAEFVNDEWTDCEASESDRLWDAHKDEEIMESIEKKG